MKQSFCKIFLIAILVFAVNQGVLAQIRAVTETGEEVILHTDGTWEYQSYVEAEEVEIPTNPKVFKKEESSTFLIKSNRLEVGFWIDPKKWSFKKSSDNADSEYELQLKKEDLYAMILAEKVEIPLPLLRNIAIESARDAAPDARITKEEYRKVNGLNVLLLRMEGTMQGMKFSYYGYYYSSSSGTVQFIAYTSQNLMEEYVTECEKLLNGIVDLK